MPAKKARTYDATARRARAEDERRATRRRVVEAARQLFLTKGYAGTTMVDISGEAGVALQSVYTAAKSKADLLQLVVDTVVAGDDEPVLMTERDPFKALGEEPDPVRQVEMIAGLIAATQERSAPVQVVFRQAAAVDDTIAANLDAELERRYSTFATIIGLIPAKHLRHSRAESTDLAWAIGSTEVFLLLRERRGWDADHYVRTITRVLVDVLLVP